MTFQELGNATYIALETFRKSGEGVKTPVWVTAENNKLYVWTDANSWKVKRIHNNETVRLCASDSRGTPKSEWFEAKARVLVEPAAITAMQKRLAKKYGFQFKAFDLLGRLRQRNRVSAVIEISE